MHALLCPLYRPLTFPHSSPYTTAPVNIRTQAQACTKSTQQVASPVPSGRPEPSTIEFCGFDRPWVEH